MSRNVSTRWFPWGATRLSALTAAVAQPTSYSYNLNDTTVSVNSSLSQTRQYQYNVLGQYSQRCEAGKRISACIIFPSAPVAQLDRADASGASGREFESLRARQICLGIPHYVRDFGCGLPFNSASLTPAKRLKFESLRDAGRVSKRARFRLSPPDRPHYSAQVRSWTIRQPSGNLRKIRVNTPCDSFPPDIVSLYSPST